MAVPMAPVSHPVLDDAEAGEEEQEWTVECNELLGQVLETQSEIASLLKAHDDTQQSLASLKRQCDDELVELQDDAWKLQVFAELQRMGQQLERLASQDEDTLASKHPDLADKSKPDVAADASTSGENGAHEAELEDLDNEIAELDKQLVAARAELQGLLRDKVALEGEVALTGSSWRPWPYRRPASHEADVNDDRADTSYSCC